MLAYDSMSQVISSTKVHNNKRKLSQYKNVFLLTVHDSFEPKEIHIYQNF